MAKTLTQASTITCPHGGNVIAVPTSRAKAVGAKVLTTADLYTVAACPHTNPSGDPSPCLSVEWTVTDRRTKMSGSPTLSTSSVGKCKAGTGAPQGVAIIVLTQAKASTT